MTVVQPGLELTTGSNGHTTNGNARRPLGIFTRPQAKSGWKSWLFWPFEVPRIGILMVASPLQELAYELQSGVYIAGEVIGAALLLWDLARNNSKHG